MGGGGSTRGGAGGQEPGPPHIRHIRELRRRVGGEGQGGEVCGEEEEGLSYMGCRSRVEEFKCGGGCKPYSILGI